MIRISKRAMEKLKESKEVNQSNLFRVYISGIG